MNLFLQQRTGVTRRSGTDDYVGMPLRCLEKSLHLAKVYCEAYWDSKAVEFDNAHFPQKSLYPEKVYDELVSTCNKVFNGENRWEYHKVSLVAGGAARVLMSYKTTAGTCTRKSVKSM